MTPARLTLLCDLARRSGPYEWLWAVVVMVHTVEASCGQFFDALKESTAEANFGRAEEGCYVLVLVKGART